MKKEPEDLLMLRLSAMYLTGGYLYEADELFYHHSKDVEYSKLNKTEKLNYLKALYIWSSKMNSNQARHLLETNQYINKYNPKELHYYILILRKKLLYPLLILTWMFT